MPCFHPKPAWQAKLGGKLSFQWVRGWRTIMVPCSTCIGCIKAHAQSWAFRCHLEATQHQFTSFATLTYDNNHLPYTLQVRHMQLFLKSLRQRATAPLRHFYSGEYGERTQRPHYHAILFGFPALGSKYTEMVADSWGKGNVRLDPISDARIAYCAGYTDKKAADRFLSITHCDPETGEVWQPPFIRMSLKPGLGSHAKRWPHSWRLFAVHQGNTIPVPRYLHNAWRATATETDLQELQLERDEFLHNRDNSQARLDAGELIATARHKLQAEQRTYDRVRERVTGQLAPHP